MNFYKNILINSVKTTLKEKKLWLFGFLAMFLSTTSIYKLFGTNSLFAYKKSILDTIATINNLGLWTISFWQNFLSLINTDLSVFCILFFVLLMISLLIIGLIWISIKSQIALIFALGKINKKSLTLKQYWQEQPKKFWSVLLTQISTQILILAIIIAISFILFLAPNLSIFQHLQNLITIAISLVIAFFLHFISLYTIFHLIIEKKSLTESIIESWKIVSKNYLLTFEFFVILLIINLSFLIFTYVVIIIISLPFILIMSIFNVLKFYSIELIIAIINVILKAFIIIIVGAFIATFETTAWFNLFEKIKEKTPIKTLLSYIKR